MSKYLDNTGLSYLWQKIKGTYVKQEAGKQLSTNDFTDEEKQKLSKINENLALEQTCQEIKQNVNMVNNKLGGFTGNTDTVETDLENLKNNMAQLQTKSDQLQSLIEQLMSKGGGSFNFDNAKLYCMEMEDTNFRTLFTTRAKIFVNGIVNVKTKNVNGRVYINGQEFLYYRSSNTYPLPENAPLLIADTNGVTIICENANSSFWVEN